MNASAPQVPGWLTGGGRGRLRSVATIALAAGLAGAMRAADPAPGGRALDLGEVPGPTLSWDVPDTPRTNEEALDQALAQSKGAQLSALRMQAALRGETRALDAESRGDGQARIDLLEKAARDGDAAALVQLAAQFAQGVGLAPDPMRAFAYYRAAALAGDMDAAHALGRIYASAAGVPLDLTEALAWLIVAHERGDPSGADAQLRQHLLNRQRADLVAAAEKRAAERRPKASREAVLAVLPPPVPLHWVPPAPEAETVDSDPAAAATPATEGPPEVVVMTITGARLTWPTVAALQRAADHDEPEALDALGRLLATGRLVPQDSLGAIVRLERAARLGNIDAAHKLGDLYTDGDGVVRDDAKGFAFYLQAARGGSVLAMANVGIDYTNGRGVAADHVQGLAWLIVAKHYGLDRGQEAKLRSFLTRNHPEKIAAAESAAAAMIREIDPHRG